METQEIKSKINRVIGEMFEVNPAEVPEDKPFSQMANYNSMRALEFLAKLETEFNIIIDPDQLPKMLNVAKSAEVVKEILGG